MFTDSKEMKELANAGPTEEEMFELFLKIASKTAAFDLIVVDPPMSAPNLSAFLSAYSQIYPIIESKDSDEDKK